MQTTHGLLLVLASLDNLLVVDPAGDLALNGFQRPVPAYNVLRLRS